MGGVVAAPMLGGRVDHPAQEAIMKPTFLWLSAAALSVITLIFVLHAQRQPSSEGSRSIRGHEGSTFQARRHRGEWQRARRLRAGLGAGAFLRHGQRIREACALSGSH